MPKIDILVEDITDEQVNTEATGVFLPLANNDPFFSITGVSLDSNYCYLITGKKAPIYVDGKYVTGVNDYIKTLVDAGFQVVVYQKQEGTDDFSFLNDKSQYNVKYLTNGYDALVKFVPEGAEESITTTTRIEAALGGYFTDYEYTQATQSENGSITYKIYSLQDGEDSDSDPDIGSYTVSVEYGYDVELVTPQNTYVNVNDILIILTKTETTTTENAYITIDNNLDTLNEIATKRADCVVLGRIEPNLSTDTINNKDLKEVKDLLKENLYEDDLHPENKDTTGCVYNRTGLFVTRHVDIDKVDTFPELEYLRLYGKLMESGETWDTVAGVNRGITDVFSANSAVSKYFLDSTVQDTEGYSFNGVVDLRPYGLVMWGDRTLTYNSESETYKNSKDEYYIKTKASSYLSTMSLVCDLCKRIYNASIENTCETNNNITWTNYKTRISQLLDEMVSAGKIRTYNFVKLESNRASIRCKIYITPLAPVENFDIDVVLTDTEVSVTTGNV